MAAEFHAALACRCSLSSCIVTGEPIWDPVQAEDVAALIMRRLQGVSALVVALACSAPLLVTIPGAAPTQAADAKPPRVLLRARFLPVEPIPASVLAGRVPVPPSYKGKSGRERSSGPETAVAPLGGPTAEAPKAPAPESAPPVVVAGTDVPVGDGSETAIAVDLGDGNTLAAALNLGYITSPSLFNSLNGNGSWTARTFPAGSGTFSFYPFDPWASPGNTTNELFASFLWSNGANPPSARMVVARSAGGGVSWSRLYEVTRNVHQDRDMFDIDRAFAQGGGSGTTYDVTLYLTFDGFDSQDNYVASYLHVVSPSGTLLREVTTSLPPLPNTNRFHGSQMQPVPGVNDGQVYLMSVASNLAGDQTSLSFHEVTGAGTTLVSDKSGFFFYTVGQQLGTGGRWGVNGHRIGAQMQMDIDRSNGPRRGTLYVLSTVNPNHADPTQDQGDVFLSVSTDGAQTWTHSLLPGLAAGKTQFFGMLDVDDDGWIHVAYYQNETGSTDNGVLNASTANLYYTVSADGGLTWTTHILVNGPGDTLQYFDPPPNLLAQDYYLIGDYAQVRAGRTSGTKVAYVFWSGYDKNRPQDGTLLSRRDRGICTKMTLTVDTDGDGLLDPQDNCPTIYNPGQEDLNTNGIGDICECFHNRANVDDTGSSQGRIDGSDLFPLARSFGSCQGDAAYNANVDLSPEGCVDGYDLALLASVFADSVPAVCP